MNKEELKAFRKEMIAKLEEKLGANQNPEDDMFYYHPSEDRIVLSHALFWVMTVSIKGKIAKEKYFLLLRQYQEEMLEAWLTESSDFKDLLHYCNVIYNTPVRDKMSFIKEAIVFSDKGTAVWQPSTAIGWLQRQKSYIEHAEG